MKTLSPALQTLLATRQFYVADLHRFTLANSGGVFDYTSADTNIVWAGNTFLCGGQTGPFFDRTGNKAKWTLRCGVDVDTLQISVLPSAATINGLTWRQAVRRGVFDGAEYTLYRAYMPTYGDTSAGALTVFGGRVGEIEAQGDALLFNVASHLELLNMGMPRNVFQAGCSNTLYDTACGLNKASYAQAGTVIAGSTDSNILCNLPQADAYFNLGVITFTSGVLNGISRTVKRFNAGGTDQITLLAPFPATPSAGDTFTVYAGCDKRKTTCQSKFANLTRFRGFPFIPENSVAI